MNMDDFMCPICLQEFDNDEFIPKVLECGHSLCSKCLSTILLSSSDAVCPTCRANIAKKKQYPHNYSLISISSKREKVLATPKEVATAVSDLKRDVTNLLSEVKRERLCKIMTFLESTLSRVVALENFEEKNISVKRVLHDVSEIREDLTRDAVQHESSVTLNRARFQSQMEYLYEVRRKIKTGHVFAIHPVGKEDKYGQVTFFGKRIFVHCLSYPPRLRNETYVSFQELKSCWMNLEFGTFLQIPRKTEGPVAFVEIELTKGQPLSHLLIQYLKLCTGEMGPSFKGAPYEQKREGLSWCLPNILTVPQHMCDGNLKTGEGDYKGVNVSTEVKAGEICVSMKRDWTFDIDKVDNEVVLDNMIGNVVSPSNLADIIPLNSELRMKIVDCGIFFNLN